MIIREARPRGPTPFYTINTVLTKKVCLHISCIEEWYPFHIFSLFQFCLNYTYTVADPGDGPRPPPNFLDKTATPRAVKNIYIGDLGPPLSEGLDDNPPTPSPLNLKVWIRHCCKLCYVKSDKISKMQLYNSNPPNYYQDR